MEENSYIDIEVTRCPIDCRSCHVIYFNEQINSKIICKCNCHKSKNVFR